MPMSDESLFRAFYALEQLIEAFEHQKYPPLALLVRTMKRAVEGSGTLLLQVVAGSSSESNVPEMMKTLSILLSYLQGTAFPVLIACSKRKSAQMADKTAEDFYGLLSTLIFLPLVRSITPFSQSWILQLFSQESKIVLYDIRPQLLSLVQAMIVLNQENAEKGLQMLKESTLLEALRQLCQIVPHSPAVDRPVLDRVAKKESLWYLVNVVYALVAPTLTSEAKYLDRPLLEAIVERLTGLVSMVSGCKGGIGNNLDEVGKSMILAMIERCWMILVSTCQIMSHD